MQVINKNIFLLLILFSFQFTSGQNFSGRILDKKNGNSISYVNVGVVNRNIGTVSDFNGKYQIEIDTQFDNDSLKFSCIGFHPFILKVSDFKKLESKDIILTEKVFEIGEVTVKPKVLKNKTLGVTTKSKFIQAGFKENQLGYECGILIKLNKSATLEKLQLNIANCSYDTVFYRVNIYKVNGKMNFENILQYPIYFELAKNQIKDEIFINLENYNINVEGDFLITLEHVKDLGPGYLYFCAGITNKTYIRKTSQGIWETAPVGISLSVQAKIEK